MYACAYVFTETSHPNNENQSDDRTETIYSNILNPANQMKSQINEISTKLFIVMLVTTVSVNPNSNLDKKKVQSNFLR